MEHLSNMNRLLNQPNTFARNLESIITIGDQIVDGFEDKEKIFGDVAASDELRPLLAAISSTDLTASVPMEVEIVLARVLKVLLRKTCNRRSLGKNGLSALIRALNRLLTQRKHLAAAEMCNVVLNTCYDGANVQLLLELDGLKPLSVLLRGRDAVLLASALGVLQGLCYVATGRQKLRQETKVLEKVAVLLESEEAAVRARAVGVMHNLSVDMVSIIPIVDTGCVSVLVRLLLDSSSEICTAAAGTLQNLARDSVTREDILACGALDSLSDLLFASDIGCQVAAVGSMLNMLGPDVPSTERQEYCRLLTDALVLGAVRSSVFDFDPEAAAARSPTEIL